MSAIKLTLFLFLGTVALAVIGSVIYLELFFIPAALVKEFGQAATLVHLLSILILIVTSAAAATWFRDWTIFRVQEILIASHLDKLMDSITHLTTGRWSADSYTHNEAFKTGAKLGFGMGYKVGEAGEVDRRAILEGIQRMQLPAGGQTQGAPVRLVEDMADYLDEIDSRKRRLQEQG
jgi:hypothetical protein